MSVPFQQEIKSGFLSSHFLFLSCFKGIFCVAVNRKPHVEGRVRNGTAVMFMTSSVDAHCQKKVSIGMVALLNDIFDIYDILQK